MSFEDVKAVMAAYIEGPSSLKFTLVALAERASAKTHDCWPSQVTIAKDINVSERTVRSAMAELERRGLITRTGRTLGRKGRTSDHIVVHTDALTAVRPLEDGETEADLPATVAGLSSEQPEMVAGFNASDPLKPAMVAGEQRNYSLPHLSRGEGGGSVGAEGHQGRHAVRDSGFPAFAKSLLVGLTPQQQGQWEAAWVGVVTMAPTLLDPVLHLTKYLAKCREIKRTPAPSDWVKWFAEDEQRSIENQSDRDRKRLEAEAASTNPYWE